MPSAEEALVTKQALQASCLGASNSAEALETPTTMPAAATRPEARKPRHLEIWRPWDPSRPEPKLRPRRRGPAAQRCRRLHEQQLRRRAVDVCLWLQERGGTLAQAADLLDLQPRTLRQWSHDCRAEPIEVVPLGRPARRSGLDQRRAALDFLKHHGPNASLHTLQQHFPAMARAELDHLRQRYRCVLHDRYHDTVHVLHWQKPGRVWAVDFAEPSAPGGKLSLPPVDGLFYAVLPIGTAWNVGKPSWRLAALA
jgi:hypothetical protein